MPHVPSGGDGSASAARTGLGEAGGLHMGRPTHAPSLALHGQEAVAAHAGLLQQAQVRRRGLQVVDHGGRRVAVVRVDGPRPQLAMLAVGLGDAQLRRLGPRGGLHARLASRRTGGAHPSADGPPALQPRDPTRAALAARPGHPAPTAGQELCQRKNENASAAHRIVGRGGEAKKVTEFLQPLSVLQLFRSRGRVSAEVITIVPSAPAPRREDPAFMHGLESALTHEVASPANLAPRPRVPGPPATSPSATPLHCRRTRPRPRVARLPEAHALPTDNSPRAGHPNQHREPPQARQDSDDMTPSSATMRMLVALTS